MIPFPWKVAAPLAVTLALLEAGCGEADSAERRERRAPPASASLEDLLPRAAPAAAPAYQPGSRFTLRPTGLAPVAPGGFVDYQVGTVLVDDGELAQESWRFALGEAELRVALGSDAVDAALVRLAAAYGGFLGNGELRSLVAAAVAAQPALGAVALDGAWDVAGLELGAVMLADGLRLDEDGDGAFETQRTALTLHLSLPSVAVPAPADPFPACAAVIGDGTAPAALAAESGRTWIAPANASWRWRISLTGHFALEDLAPTHRSLWEPTAYPSQGERDAAAHDLGLFAGFLQDPAAGLPGSDLVVTVEPDPSFAAPTLHVVASLARAARDAECLRQVDGWLAEVTLLQPSLTAGQVAGGPPAGYLLHDYAPGVDGADGIVDPGLTCLRDAAGNPVQVAGEPACATASGPLEAVQLAPGAAATAVTPYLRMSASFPSSLAMGEIAPCTSSPWNAMCTERFGRGIRLCLGEWALRKQVGDYWNIHWGQSPKKSSIQSVIKAGGYVLRGVVFVYMGEGEVLPLIYLAAAKEGTAYLADLATNTTGKPVAGYGISFAGGKLYKMLLASFLEEGVVEEEPGVLKSFLAERVIDGLAQMAEVEAVGWQDYSKDSHCACGFEYKDPDYCK